MSERRPHPEDPDDIAEIVENYIFKGGELSPDEREDFAKSANPKPALARMAKLIIAARNPAVVARYQEMCKLADQKTDYDAYGPVKTISDGDGVISRGRKSRSGMRGSNYRSRNGYS